MISGGQARRHRSQRCWQVAAPRRQPRGPCNAPRMLTMGWWVDPPQALPCKTTKARRHRHRRPTAAVAWRLLAAGPTQQFRTLLLSCRWFHEELPAALRSRQPPHLTQPELVKLVGAGAMEAGLGVRCLQSWRAQPHPCFSPVCCCIHRRLRRGM